MLLGGAKCFGPGSNGTQGKAACQGTALERMHQLELHHPSCCSCKVQGLSWRGGTRKIFWVDWAILDHCPD